MATWSSVSIPGAGRCGGCTTRACRCLTQKGTSSGTGEATGISPGASGPTKSSPGSRPSSCPATTPSSANGWTARSSAGTGVRSASTATRPPRSSAAPSTSSCPRSVPGKSGTSWKESGRGERIEHYETERLTKDGRRIVVSITISPIVDVAGHVIGASTIARDITEQQAGGEGAEEEPVHPGEVPGDGPRGQLGLERADRRDELVRRGLPHLRLPAAGDPARPSNGSCPASTPTTARCVADMLRDDPAARGGGAASTTASCGRTAPYAT